VAADFNIFDRPMLFGGGGFQRHEFTWSDKRSLCREL
jgi:hypothetical protein